MTRIDIATLRRIRKAVMSGKKTKKEIAEKYGVSVSTVMRIAKMSDKEFEEYIQRKKEQQKRAKKKCKK
jgi:Trp operon repressor